VTAKICYYADDMTGATDALANFAEWGLTTRLVLDPGDVADAAEGVEVLGIAGTARGLRTEEMAGELVPALRALAAVGPGAVQYKICSTFDSSPTVGSIGRAAEILTDVWGPGAIPVLAAQPGLGRWTAFGTHFAAGPDGRVHRLDRHPTMAIHPVTPALDADLVNVLSAQTTRLGVTAVHLPDLDRYAELVPGRGGLVVLDAVSDDDLQRLGALIWQAAVPPRPVVAVGSGGLSYALASRVGRQGAGSPPPPDRRPVLALSGSLSEETRLQTDVAAAAGWDVVDVVALGAHEASNRAAAALGAGGSVVVSTTVGAHASRFAPGEAGPLLADCAARLVPAAGARRLLLAGGDTSGTLMRAIGARGLDYAGRIGGTGVLCRLRGRGLDHTQVVLKGGKIGAPDFFERVRAGS
jgi:3-oxoisoapionate kinase